MVAKKFFSDKQIDMRQYPEIEKHLINRNVQAQKISWHVILHSHLWKTLCKFFIKSESN